MKKTAFLILSAAFFLARPTAAEEQIVYESGIEKTSLVQLFTSDASAACNPALEWVSAQKNSPVLWKEYIPVAMHVKRWDAGSYKDTFTRPEFDEMLSGYQRSWGASNMYAPTMVANGTEWSGWSRGQDVPPDREKPVGVLSARTEKFKDKYDVTFKPEAAYKDGSFTLHACLLTFGSSSHPSDGKNRGKSLVHDFIAVLYRKQDLVASRGVYGTSIEVHPPKGQRGGHFGVVFWITAAGSQLPLQAAGGYLPE